MEQHAGHQAANRSVFNAASAKAFSPTSNISAPNGCTTLGGHCARAEDEDVDHAQEASV
jgi:hypothetical protein